MKRKLLIVLLAVISAVCLALCLAACSGGDNTTSGGGSTTPSGSGGHIHTYGRLIKEVPATCTKEGMQAHYYCEGCRTYFTEQKVETTEQELKIPISANSHSLNEGESNCADCGTPLTTGLEFKLLDDDTYSVGKGTATDSNIIIPAKYNSKPVTSIGESAFKDCTNLESIIIPDSVTYIQSGAFSNCINLENIKIPDSVTVVSKGAFYGCTKLIQTEGGVQYVDKWVIGCDASAINVNLRADTKYIADSAFFGCLNLESVTFENAVGWKVYRIEHESEAQDVNVDDATKNVRLLTDTYYYYYWKRF